MPEHYGLFVLATALLMLTPGPNVALIVANSVAHGARFGLLTVAGTTAAFSLQLALVAAGLAGGLAVAGTVFEWVRWAGVIYLVALGVQTWRAAPADLAGVRPQARAAWRIVAQAFLVGSTNPKVLLFYAAFFPQFIAARRPVGPQLLVLCVTFVLVAVVIDSLWALGAARAQGRLRASGRLRQRISGGLLVGAGLGLAAARR